MKEMQVSKSIAVNKTLWRKIAKMASKADRSTSYFIRAILQEYVDNHKNASK